MAAYRLLAAPMFPQTYGVAHAGGRIGGQIYTNSVAAFDVASDRGFTLIEVDLQKTADGHVVCGHDWNAFGGMPPSLSQWQVSRLELDYPPCSLEELLHWFSVHPGIKLVSDVEQDTLEINRALHVVLGERLVAQAYDFADVAAYQQAGITNTILTLYRYPSLGEKWAAIDALAKIDSSLVAVTMPGDDVVRGLALWAKLMLGIPVYAHTINSCGIASGLQWFGADAFYSDDFGPRGCSAN